MLMRQSTILLCAFAAFGSAQLPGGWSPLQTDSNEANEITSFVQATINARSNSMYLSKVTDISKMERQVVAGFNYRLSFDFSRTKCTKSSGQDLESCNDIQTVEVCTASVYKSLLPTLELTRFNCQPKDVKRACGGCIVDADGNFDDIAQFAVNSINDAENSDRKLIAVTSAKKQVVAGTLYHLTVRVSNGDQEEDCQVKVWERLWLNDIRLTDSSCQPVQELKRQIAGGRVVQSNPSAFADQAQFAVDAISGKENSLNELLDVVKVETQVVAGILYHMTVRVKTAGQGERVCAVQVWERAWLPAADRRQLASSSCSAAKVKRAGQITQHPNPESLMDVAAFGIGEVNSRANSAFVVSKVVSAKTQVVAGKMYYLTVEVTEGDKVKQCDVNVWERLWLSPPRQLTSTTC